MLGLNPPPLFSQQTNLNTHAIRLVPINIRTSKTNTLRILVRAKTPTNKKGSLYMIKHQLPALLAYGQATKVYLIKSSSSEFMYSVSPFPTANSAIPFRRDNFIVCPSIQYLRFYWQKY